jgi:hypothetical protein
MPVGPAAGTYSRTVLEHLPKPGTAAVFPESLARGDETFFPVCPHIIIIDKPDMWFRYYLPEFAGLFDHLGIHVITGQATSVPGIQIQDVPEENSQPGGWIGYPVTAGTGCNPPGHEPGHMERGKNCLQVLRHPSSAAVRYVLSGRSGKKCFISIIRLRPSHPEPGILFWRLLFFLVQKNGTLHSSRTVVLLPSRYFTPSSP